MLKVGWPHMEARDEIDGLLLWNGDPTVRVLEANRELNAMLLERCEAGGSPARAAGGGAGSGHSKPAEETVARGT